MSVSYFIQSGVLMWKWKSVDASSNEDWHTIYHIVVPLKYLPEILSLAHGRMTMSVYVITYCKTCRECQLTGKPNQTIPPAPLHPIPAFGELPERVIIDCVGPLTRSRRGNQYLLTIMCAATCYPDAVPLRKITAPVIVKAFWLS